MGESCSIIDKLVEKVALKSLIFKQSSFDKLKLVINFVEFNNFKK